MSYQEVLPITRQEAEAVFSGQNIKDICDALVRVTYHDNDPHWLQKLCFRFCRHDSAEVRGLAVQCFGHIARIHRTLDLQRVKAVLTELLADTEISGRVEDAMDDINMFVRNDE